MTAVRMPELGEIWRRRDREFRIVEVLPYRGPEQPLWLAEQVGTYTYVMPDGGQIMVPHSTVAIYADNVRNGRWTFVRAA